MDTIAKIKYVQTLVIQHGETGKEARDFGVKRAGNEQREFVQADINPLKMSCMQCGITEYLPMDITAADAFINAHLGHEIITTINGDEH